MTSTTGTWAPRPGWTRPGWAPLPSCTWPACGAGGDSPSEFGARDGTLSITAPGYGAAVSSPLTVGGRITGVDEALRVAVIDGNGRTLGRVSGVPAGGGNTPWSVAVGFARPAGGVLTVVVSTGGHVAEVERFAITAVRAGGSGCCG